MFFIIWWGTYIGIIRQPLHFPINIAEGLFKADRLFTEVWPSGTKKR